MSLEEKTTMPFFMVAIGGPSCSGKTTAAYEVVKLCQENEITAQVFSLDHYYRPLTGMSEMERAETNFDLPGAINIKEAHADLISLKSGMSIKQPRYNFKTHTREISSVVVSPTSVIIVEGNLALYYPEIKGLADLKIYFATTIENCVVRRFIRDVQERGRTVEEIAWRLSQHVNPAYRQYVLPSKTAATFSCSWGEDQSASAISIFSLIKDKAERREKYFEKKGSPQRNTF